MKTYSENFVEKKLDQIEKLQEKLDEDFPVLPDFDLDSNPREERLYKETQKVLKHRSKLSYVQGFWYGYSLGIGVPKEENK